MTHLDAEHFDQNARAALQDATLRQALRRATDLFAERRARAIGAVEDWEALREQARAIKAHTLARLDHYLTQFADQAERAGVKVHWAKDAAAACRIVAQIAADHDCHRLVKAKSMATEEIGLNAALARADKEPIETDLGEWIIQLAGETPSHIIVPAIHKTRQAIGALFVDQLGIPPTTEPAVLADHARQRLRAHFAQADLGISGVNFGVAETGTILILENEGNARMTTTLPRVHIAVMGIEKVIPRFADLEVFLRLLPRSGTGQHLTTYQSLLTGPSPQDGPRELHVVLLDNGRSRIVADEAMRSTLACIRCGACLNACPVYQQIGGHAYGSVYPGPIGAILSPQLDGHAGATTLPFASSLCGACKDVCPVKIDIPSLLLELRHRAVLSPPPHQRRRPFLERLGFRLWAFCHRGPRRQALLMFLTRLLLRVPGVRRLGPAGAWTATRELPAPPRLPFRRRPEARR
ncbi:MAG: iron-sulfur cluster-binding protein [Planctomycetes bacterium]|nr:iron-sulfur cluster-binding protein [Planctomycetota bacterium]